MKYKSRCMLFLTALVCGLASTTAIATTWDFEGVVDFCNGFACNLTGIAVGAQVVGFITADDAVSGPGSTFGAADLVNYGIAVQDITIDPSDSTLDSATLTTNATGELTSGSLVIFGVFDGGLLGNIDLNITVDVGAGTWIIATNFLGIGVVASGPGQWSLEADGDGLAAVLDNCTEVANPAQRDTDADGIGNICDPDFNQDCAVNFPDLSFMSANFFSPGDLDTDLDGSGMTNFGDLSIMSGYFFSSPGPSGIPNVCSPSAGAIGPEQPNKKKTAGSHQK